MVEVVVKKCSVKSITIRNTTDGRIELRVPLNTSQKTIDEIIRRHRPRIEAMAEKRRKATDALGALPAVDDISLKLYTENTKQLLQDRLSVHLRDTLCLVLYQSILLLQLV